jgi:actin related protein 2/3 complex subunit 5
MSEYAFRKIDIDALDEDVLLPSDLFDPDPRGPDGALADAKRKSTDVRNLVSKWVPDRDHVQGDCE